MKYTDFQKFARISGLFSKSFAGEMMALLVAYDSISASEAASRLNLHIKTAQDFLEGLSQLDVVSRREVKDGKRPYFRYRLVEKVLAFSIDFRQLDQWGDETEWLHKKIREKKGSGAKFTTSGKGNAISSITIFEGEGRRQKARKINLTDIQGRFLYYLPFPTASFLSIGEILKKSKIEERPAEILDMVSLLLKMDIVEAG